jgi:hypothetical protein
MKSFIKNTTRFTFFVIIIIIIFQAILSLKIKNKSLNDDDNLEQTSNINADLVFLGSSRCWVHFDPVFFDETFKIKSVNIGVNGHTITMAILRLQNYLSRNKPPKFAILSFDPSMNPGSEIDNTNFMLKDEFARYSFLPEKKNLPIVSYFKFNFYEKYIPLYSIFKYKLLDDCLYIKTKKFNMNCNHLVDKKWDTIHNPIENENYGNYFTKNHMISLTNLLKKLKKICSDNNIKLFCIQTPIYKSVQDDLAFKNATTICKSLNVPFLDVNVEPIRSNINYFYSPWHLNKKGVEQMNQLLKKEDLLTSFFFK